MVQHLCMVTQMPPVLSCWRQTMRHTCLVKAQHALPNLLFELVTPAVMLSSRFVVLRLTALLCISQVSLWWIARDFLP